MKNLCTERSKYYRERMKRSLTALIAAGIADPDQDGPPVKPIRIYQVWTF